MMQTFLKRVKRAPVLVLALAMLAVTLGGGCGGGKKDGGKKQKTIAQIQKDLKDDPAALAKKLIDVAENAQELKDRPRAKEAIEAAAKAAEKINGDKHEVRATTFIDLASGQFVVKVEDDAKKSVDKALEEIDELEGKAEVQADLLVDLAKMLIRRKRGDDIDEPLKAAEEKVSKIKAVDGQISVLAKVASAFARAKENDEAKRVVASALKITDTMEEKSIAKAEAVARIAGAQDDYDEDAAEATFKKAKDIAESIEQDWVKVNAMYKVAGQMYSAGEKQAAKKLLTEAKDLSAEITDAGQRKEVQRSINELFKKLERKKK